MHLVSALQRCHFSVPQTLLLCGRDGGLEATVDHEAVVVVVVYDLEPQCLLKS